VLHLALKGGIKEEGGGKGVEHGRRSRLLRDRGETGGGRRPDEWGRAVNGWRERGETEQAACRSWASGAIWAARGTAGRKKEDGPVGKEEGKLGLGPKGKGRRVGEGFVFLLFFLLKPFQQLNTSNSFQTLNLLKLYTIT
jgi:hypothetical protein